MGKTTWPARGGARLDTLFHKCHTKQTPKPREDLKRFIFKGEKYQDDGRATYHEKKMYLLPSATQVAILVISLIEKA